MFVAAKLSPVHNTKYPIRSTSTYVKQSPKLNPAGYHPLPYRHQPLITQSTKSTSTNTISTFASRRNQSTTSYPTNRNQTSMTIPSSTRITTGISRAKTSSKQTTSSSPPGSPKMTATA